MAFRHDGNKNLEYIPIIWRFDQKGKILIMIMMINIAQRLQPAASEQEVHWEARAMFVKNGIVLLDPYSNALC